MIMPPFLRLLAAPRKRFAFGIRDPATFQHQLLAKSIFETTAASTHLHVVLSPYRTNLILHPGLMERKFYRTGTHHEYFPDAAALLFSPNLHEFTPINGLELEGALRCFGILCRYLSTNIREQKLVVSLTLDVRLSSEIGAQRVFDATQPLAGLLQHIEILAISTREQEDVRRIVRKAAQQLAKPPQVHRTSFPFMKMPPEIQSMVLAHAVTDDGRIPIQYPNSYGISPVRWPHAARCCGHCRRKLVLTDIDCRSINNESYSTTCRCVFLSDGIFLTTKDLREEALRLYWKKNIFLIAGFDEYDIASAISSFPEFRKIQRLDISSSSLPSVGVLTALQANPELRIEISFSSKLQCEDSRNGEVVYKGYDCLNNFEKMVIKLGLRLRAWASETTGYQTLLIDCMR